MPKRSERVKRARGTGHPPRDHDLHGRQVAEDFAAPELRSTPAKPAVKVDDTESQIKQAPSVGKDAARVAILAGRAIRN